MLKKITISSILILLIALVVAVAFLPKAIKDFLHNGDQILNGIFSTTPVSSFNGADYDAVHIAMNNAEVFLEQSSDDRIYMRVEGLFADTYNIATEDIMVEDQRVLNIRFDSEGLFFDNNISSYLMRRTLMEGTYSAVILRIPSNVSVTTDYPYQVNYDSTVQFVNRDYYENREWHRADQERYEQERAMEESASKMKQRFYTLRDTFISELDVAIARPYTYEDPSLEELDEEIDEITIRYSEEMKAQLFPFPVEEYSIETLRLLLQNYMDLTSAYKKQSARAENYYSKDENEAYEIDQNCERLDTLCSNALESFTNLYQSYLNAAVEEENETMTQSSSEEEPTPPESVPSSGEETPSLPEKQNPADTVTSSLSEEPQDSSADTEL